MRLYNRVIAASSGRVPAVPIAPKAVSRAERDSKSRAPSVMNAVMALSVEGMADIQRTLDMFSNWMPKKLCIVRANITISRIEYPETDL